MSVTVRTTVRGALQRQADLNVPFQVTAEAPLHSFRGLKGESGTLMPADEIQDLTLLLENQLM